MHKIPKFFRDFLYGACMAFGWICVMNFLRLGYRKITKH